MSQENNTSKRQYDENTRQTHDTKTIIQEEHTTRRHEANITRTQYGKKTTKQ